MGGMDKESLRQFNYYGQTRLENLDEHDIVGLEREIDFIIRHSAIGNNYPNRGMTANPDPTIIDINGGDNFLPKKRNKTAGHVNNPRFAKKKALKNKKNSLNAVAGLPNKMNRSHIRQNMSNESLEAHIKEQGIDM